MYSVDIFIQAHIKKALALKQLSCCYVVMEHSICGRQTHGHQNCGLQQVALSQLVFISLSFFAYTLYNIGLVHVDMSCKIVVVF